MISQQQVLNNIRNPEDLNQILKFSRYSQIKHSKLVYNRHCRKISLFRKQMDEMEQKMRRSEQEAKRVRKISNVDRYDDNQLKQLQFRIGTSRRIHTQGDYETQTLITLNKNHVADGFKGKRKKYSQLPSITTRKLYIDKNGRKSPRKVQNRPKSLSQSVNQPKYLLSPLKLRQKAFTIFQNKISIDNKLQPVNQKVKILLTDQELETALEHLYLLVFGRDQSIVKTLIQEESINELIRQRYHMKLKKTSQMSKPDEESPYLVQIPYCEFVGFKKSKRSIEDIFNLSIKSAQKLAFKIYDRNGNGIIDQKDIIQLFSEADENAAIKPDLQIIVKHYSASIDYLTDSKNEIKNVEFKSSASVENSLRQFSEISQIALQNSIGNKSRMSERIKHQKSLKFFKQRFHTFLETKGSNLKDKRNTRNVVSLDWPKFQKAFEGRRPMVILDMLSYLFGLNSQQIYERSLQLHIKNSQSIHKIMPMNKPLKKKQQKVSPQQTMGTTKIGSMIKKAKLIERVNPIKLT